MRSLVLRMRFKEWSADRLQSLAHRADPSRPVVLRADHQATGSDWTVWVQGHRIANISPGSVAEAVPGWRPRFWS